MKREEDMDTNYEQFTEKLENISEKIDHMDRTNKKFLMAVTGLDELISGGTKLAQLHDYNKKILNVLFGILDQVDLYVTENIEKMSSEMQDGLEQITKKNGQLLEEIGIQEIPCIGLQFDQSYHDCKKIESNPEKKDGEITGIWKRGFKRIQDDTVLRYAEVIVNQVERG